VEKYREIRTGNREFQWRVKKVDGAIEALLAAGFVVRVDAAAAAASPTGETRSPKEYMYWAAEGQQGLSIAHSLVEFPSTLVNS